jgi:hypothetical protein
MENAKRLALALAQNPAPAIPSITQTDEDMDWEKVTTDPAKQHPAPATNWAPAPSPSLPAEATAYNEDEDAEIETMYSDYPTDDLKPAADITVTKHTTDQLECDDEEDEEDDDDAGPGNDVPTQHTEHCEAQSWVLCQSRIWPSVPVPHLLCIPKTRLSSAVCSESFPTMNLEEHGE